MSEGRNTPEVTQNADMIYAPVAASTTIYDGNLVALNATGYAVPAEKAENLIVVGRAEEYVNNSEGADGAVFINVKRGTFIWDNDSTPANQIKAEHLMKECYILNETTVTSVATGSSKAGKVVGIYEDGIAVETL